MSPSVLSGVVKYVLQTKTHRQFADLVLFSELPNYVIAFKVELPMEVSLKELAGHEELCSKPVCFHFPDVCSF